MGSALHKIERGMVAAATTTRPEDLSHLCSFYRSVVVRGFCLHAWEIFDDGRDGGFESEFFAPAGRERRG